MDANKRRPKRKKKQKTTETKINPPSKISSGNAKISFAGKIYYAPIIQQQQQTLQSLASLLFKTNKILK